MAALSDETQESKPKKKKSKKILIFLGVPLLLLALGAGVFFLGGPQKIIAHLQEKETKSLTLPSITVNLEDAGYVKTTITLEYLSDKKLDHELEEKSYKVKDCIIAVLRKTSSASLQDPQETETLKKTLLQEINRTLTSGKITGLYFEEFIVQ